MVSFGLVVLLFSIGISRGSVVDRVDNVIQNLLNQYKLPQGGDYHFDEELFLNHAEQFKTFILEFNRNYETDNEIENRFNIFRTNLNEIETFKKYEEGTAEYGVTEFADLELHEFNEKLGLTPILDLKKQLENIAEEHLYNVSEHPHSKLGADDVDPYINYVEKGKVLKKVQDQRQCGSCWAHAVASTIESAHCIKHNELVELSKQQIIDCDDNDDGCCGGSPFRAYAYVRDVGGIMAEKDYKQRIYEGKCEFDKSKVQAKVKNYVYLYTNKDPTYNEYKYMKYLTKVGPFVAIMNASGLRFYKGGIINQPHIVCSKLWKSLNHALLNVGYGTETIGNEKLKYFIIKNSWGPNWGDKGYFKILRGKNICGIGYMGAGVTVV